MSDVYRIIKDSTHEERSLKDGQYSCTCCHCLRTFTGHKRSVCCEICRVEPPKLAADKAQDAQPCEDKDPFYCWCVRCQLALMCKNKQPTEQTAQPCPDCGAQGDQDGTR